MSVTLSPTISVGEIASAYAAAPMILFEKQIDFCCGGFEPFEQVCARKGLDAGALLSKIALASKETEEEPLSVWQERPLDALIEHILKVYHDPLREQIPTLEKMVLKVHNVHKDKAPEMLPSLVQAFLRLRSDLQPHMAKEEQILFPWIRSGRGESAGPPVRVMLMEHDAVGAILEEIRKLTDDYQLPTWACATVTALWNGLKKLDIETHQHIHLENHVLFPRALRGDS